jgi:D-hydroxyproline dehydrogenase subunit alpha
LSAAIAAARHGVRVAVYDENPRPGGQYFRQMPESFRAGTTPILGPEHRDGHRLFQDLARLPIEWNPSTTVWGLFPEKTLGVFDGRTAELVQADYLLLAVGADDRPLPFPGSTLPGIITAGAAQNLLKGQAITPGQRVLLAGTGPLQLVVATNLLKTGARVLAVCEASPMLAAWRQLSDLLGHWALLREGWGYLCHLRRARVRLLRGHAVIRAEGSERVETTVTAALDARGQPVPGTEERFAVDSLVLGYGFVP